MKLTPLDIRHKEFKRGMRGYADGEVDEFLDEVADEFERLFKDNIDLAERVETLEDKVNHYRTLEETLQKTLVSAQRSAEELKTNAQKEAQLILHEAELKARQMVNESYADKQGVEKKIVVLKGAEEDFRFKFRSLLEGYLNQVNDLEQNARKDSDFARTAEEIKRAMAQEETVAAAAQAPPDIPVAGPAIPLDEPVGGEPAGAPPDPQATVTFALEPESAAAPARAEPESGAEAPGVDAEPAAANVMPEPAPPQAPATEASVEPGAPGAGPLFGESDDLLADVESEVEDNEFKW